MDKLFQEWQDMINSGTLPIFEIELIDDEYLLVNLELNNDGIEFSFDGDDKPVYFDGEIVSYKNNKNRFLIRYVFK